MTFKDLQKLVQHSQQDPKQENYCKDYHTNLWYWDPTRHKKRASKGECCMT